MEAANEIIIDLKAKLTELQPVLQEKTVQTEQLIGRLEVDAAAAAEAKSMVLEEEAIVNEKAERAQAMKGEADKILNEALPTLQAAAEALNTLNRNVRMEFCWGNDLTILKYN